jgi:hypothetical protein
MRPNYQVMLGSLALALVLFLGMRSDAQRISPDGLPYASSSHVVVIQAATAGGIEQKINDWFKKFENRNKRLLPMSEMRLYTPSYEVLGSRGSEPLYTAVIWYVE